jgi:hypothetical protein
MTTPAASLTASELARLLRAANPGAILLPPRRLRRVIKEDRSISGLGLQVPHQRSYTISRERLLRLMKREELGFAPDQHLPATLLLFTQPELIELENQPRQQVLRYYWRLLFHARIHAALDRHVAEGQLTPQAIAARISRIGNAAFSEIRLVLEQERYLLPPADEPTVYAEFAALYLELRQFAPHLPPVYFPSIEDFAAIDALLAEDVDAASLLMETRLAGVSDPVPILAADDAKPAARSTYPPSESERLSLATRTARAERKGNLVRVARLQQLAGNEAEARIALDQLGDRLQGALALNDEEKASWRAVIETLRVPAADGLWPVEARLLYDLQKVCIDRERLIYAVDLVEWAYSLGDRPLKRELPGQTEWSQVKHLRSARRRAAATRLGESDRETLEALLEAAVERAEIRMREMFRPRVAEVLYDVGMRPDNLPERVALNKLTEELLDRAVERGYLRMGDLRDAVSRNNLRLPDLSGPREFFRGDKLIRANRRLPVLLDGVYRRGEFYLRWLQRISSVAFGTAIGRLLAQYLLLPFGGAFLTLEGVQHIVALGVKLFVGEGFAVAAVVESETAKNAEAEQFHFATPTATFIVGLLIFCLIHSAVFRLWCIQALVAVGQGLRFLVIDLPAKILDLAVVQWLLSSRAIVWFGTYLARPLVAGLSIGILSLLALSHRESSVAGAAAFVAGCFFFNSRLATELEEAFLDGLSRLWFKLSLELLPALFHFIMALFKSLVEGIDRLLYAVDERLRFRVGDSRWTFAWKLVLGSFWFLVSYVIRLYVNLFIEPTTNPIKHFPVVTVAAKIMAPFMLILFNVMTDYLERFMNYALADAVAALHVLILPGIFGFLAWELKANWRLYRSNQPRTLEPDVIGHHGETLHGLLKLGFHSGTVPKCYRKLRRAERHGDASSARRQRDLLNHIAENVRAFTERELIYLLDLSPAWGAVPVQSGRIRLGCTSIRVELLGCASDSQNLEMFFMEQSGTLTAFIAQTGWLENVSENSRHAFEAALAGWYQHAAARSIDKPKARAADLIAWNEWLATWENARPGQRLHGTD